MLQQECEKHGRDSPADTQGQCRRSEWRCFKCQNRFYIAYGKDHGEAGCSPAGQEGPHQSRYTHCSLCRNPHSSSSSDRTESHRRPMRSSLFLKDHTPWKAHALQQVLKNLPGGKDIVTVHDRAMEKTQAGAGEKWEEKGAHIVMNWPEFHCQPPCTAHWGGCRKVRNEEVKLSLGRTRWGEKVYLLPTILLFFFFY